MSRAARFSGKLRLRDLTRKADQVRRDVVAVAVRNGAGHIAPSLSCIEILTVLYYRLMNRSADPQWKDRDRLVFSKAHGCYGLYSILADIGYLPQEAWQQFYKGSHLHGCCDGRAEEGIDASCGSLGHGLPMAAGMAFGARLQARSFRVYCVVGDGEMQEGSNWEAVQFAAKHHLGNLAIIVDHNRLQAMDFLENILTIKGRKADLRRKFAAFGVEVRTCRGHDVRSILSAIEPWVRSGDSRRAPLALIAHTIKGCGLRCMEDDPKFHFRLPSKPELAMGTRA
jgi:transketolase